MLKNVLKTPGVTPLSKKQLQAISGSSDICRFTFVYSDGTRETKNLLVEGRGQDVSQNAHDGCTRMAALQSVSRCFYDCQWDDPKPELPMLA